MKRTGNLYKEICDPTNLELAHRHARKGKGWYAEVMKVNNDLDRYLDELRESMISQSYETSEYQVFSRSVEKKVRKSEISANCRIILIELLNGQSCKL